MNINIGDLVNIKIVDFHANLINIIAEVIRIYDDENIIVSTMNTTDNEHLQESYIRRPINRIQSMDSILNDIKSI